MKTFTCIIVDAQIAPQKNLRDFVSKIKFLKLTHVFEEFKDAIQTLKKNPPDIIFLDIEKPSLFEFELLNSFQEKSKIIITTTYSHLAKDSFDFGVHDFLHKPYTFERFFKAINRAINQQVEIKEVKSKNFIFLKNGIQLDKFLFDEILYVEAYGNYCRIYLKNNKHELVTESISNLESKLPKDIFFRVHKSYIISVLFLQSVKSKNLIVQNIELPIGDSFKENLSAIVSTN